MSDNVIIGVEASAFSPDEVNEGLEPIAGDTIVGQLDGSLVAGFVELINVENDIGELQDQMRKRLLLKQADSMYDLPDLEDLNAVVDALSKHSFFANENEAIAVFKKVAEYNELNATFWRTVRIQFDVWNDWLEIRKDFRVVSTGKKFTAK